MTTLPPKPHDTREGIFNQLFKCRIRDIDTMSTDYMREFGVPYSGDLETDMAILKAPVQRYFTINEMVEFFRKGIPFNVIRYEDTAIIYEKISDHLNAWRKEIEFSYDARHAPLQDLIDLDKLASVVYDKARFVFDHEFVESRNLRGIDSLFSDVLGIGKIFAESTEVKPDESSKDDPHAHLPKRDSLEEIFASRLS